MFLDQVENPGNIIVNEVFRVNLFAENGFRILLM